MGTTRGRSSSFWGRLLDGLGTEWRRNTGRFRGRLAWCWRQRPWDDRPGMADDGDDLARVLRAADQGSSRSRLYQWMRQHHENLAAQFGKVRPNWTVLAAEFAALGIMDSTGKPATPERTRKTWWRVRADVQRAQARNLVGASPAAAVPSPALTPAPAAPPVATPSLQPLTPTPSPTSPSPPAPDNSPVSLSEGVNPPARPRFGFARPRQ